MSAQPPALTTNTTEAVASDFDELFMGAIFRKIWPSFKLRLHDPTARLLALTLARGARRARGAHRAPPRGPRRSAPVASRRQSSASPAVTPDAGPVDLPPLPEHALGLEGEVETAKPPPAADDAAHAPYRQSSLGMPQRECVSSTHSAVHACVVHNGLSTEIA